MTTSDPPALACVDPQSLAARIRSELLNRGWTMMELHRRTHISRGTLYHLKRGDTERPQMQTIQALSRAFDVTARSLLESIRTPCEAHPIDRCDRTAEQIFDRATNPVVSEVRDEEPCLFAGWTDGDLDELYSMFGTGGQLTRGGVISAAESINRKRETIRKLHVVLETGLKDQAVDLIDALYRLVRVPPASAAADAALQAGTSDS